MLRIIKPPDCVETFYFAADLFLPADFELSDGRTAPRQKNIGGCVLGLARKMTQTSRQGHLHSGGMARDAPWRKLGEGGNFVMIMMLLLVSIVIYYYMNTFVTLHQCTFNLLFV